VERVVDRDEGPRALMNSNIHKNWPQRVEAVCAVLLVFITGLYAFYAKRQRDAMLESNRINVETLHSVQRAFINVKTPLKPVFRFDPTSKEATLEFAVSLENSGTTPAIHAGEYIHTDWVKADEIGAFPFVEPANFPSGDTTIGPKATINTVASSEPEGKVFQANPNVPLLLWGIATYRDIFPDTKPHLTEFCVMLTSMEMTVNPAKPPPRPPYNPEDITFNFTTCQYHNCVDQECKDYTRIAAKLK
jgi:hypothetical protein